MQTYALQQTVAPTEPPVSLEELQDHCRIDLDADNDLLLSLGETARESLEIVTGRQFLTATYLMGLDAFPRCGVLAMPKPPLQSVTSITYTDTAGATQTLATTVYGVETLSEPARVYLKPGQSWPSTYDIPNVVQVTFVAGWEDVSQVPAGLKQAIKLLVGHWYEQREATVEKSLTEIPLGVQRLAWHHTVKEIA